MQLLRTCLAVLWTKLSGDSKFLVVFGSILTQHLYDDKNPMGLLTETCPKLGNAQSVAILYY